MITTYNAAGSTNSLPIHLIHLAYKMYYWPTIGQTSNGRWRLSSSSVTLHGRPAGGFTRAGQAMTSCRLQSNYTSTAARRASRVTSH